MDIGAYEVQSYITAVAVGWGTQTAALQTASDGLRLLPAGRNTDLPWLGIDQVELTLTQPARWPPATSRSLAPAARTTGRSRLPARGRATRSPWPSRSTRPIGSRSPSATDLIATFTRRLDVLPGDVNDDGVVNVQDMVAIRNQMLGLLGAVPTIFGDINGDGKVDINDYTAVRKLIGTTLPPIT